MYIYTLLNTRSYRIARKTTVIVLYVILVKPIEPHLIEAA